MNSRIVWRAATAAAMALTLTGQALAQPAHTPAQTRVEGVLHDFTLPPPAPDTLGAWQIDGEWSLALNHASGKVEFLAALNMVRADNATRQTHTHHVRMIDGQVTPIANGHRISGTAAFTSNGALAGFSGSPVSIELTGGNGLAFATVKVKFGGAAAVHFGDQALGGVVRLPK